MDRNMRRRLARLQLTLQQRHERLLEARLREEMQRVATDAAKAYPNMKPAMRRHLEALAAILTPSMVRTATAAGQGVLNTLPLAPKQTEHLLDTMEQLNARIAKVVRQRAADSAKNISSSTREIIRKVVAKEVEAGSAPGTIARAIRDDLGERSLGRARTIARTESAIARSTGEQASAEHASRAMGMPMEKTWTATNDDSTRETHAEADGQTVALSQPFTVGSARMMHPSDPNGPPEEVINCRCVCTYAPA